MKIILTNGTELYPSVVSGAKKFIQGVSRDTLTFMFDGSEDMAALDAAFSPEACESIVIIGVDGNESIHKAYTVRAELKKETVEVEPATDSEEAVYEEHVTVSMSQRTYSETQLASLTETVDALVLESLMA